MSQRQFISQRKSLFLVFQIIFLSTFIYIFSLIPDEFCRDKHVLKEITRNITALSDKLVDRYQQLFTNSRLHRLSSLNERKILLFWEKIEFGRRVSRTFRERVYCYYTGEARSNGPLPLPLLVSWCGLEEHNAAKPPAIRLQSDIFTQLLVIGRSSRAKSS